MVVLQGEGSIVSILYQEVVLILNAFFCYFFYLISLSKMHKGLFTHLAIIALHLF